MLPLMAARPQPVEPGDAIRVEASIELGGAVAAPARYALRAEIVGK